MDWCAAKILLEMKCATLLKRLKTTVLDCLALENAQSCVYYVLVAHFR
jgi:hypothetical protein